MCLRCSVAADVRLLLRCVAGSTDLHAVVRRGLEDLAIVAAPARRSFRRRRARDGEQGRPNQGGTNSDIANQQSISVHAESLLRAVADQAESRYAKSAPARVVVANCTDTTRRMGFATLLAPIWLKPDDSPIE